MITQNYGLARRERPTLDASAHIERAKHRLCFPEEIRTMQAMAAAMLSGRLTPGRG